VVTGFLSGIYPALTISSYRPVMITTVEAVMKRRTVFRNVLVVFQFAVSTGLIISFLLVSKQLNYLNGKELGLDKENILIIPSTRKLVEKLDAFRQELMQNPNIISLSASKRVPSDGLLDSGSASIVADDNVTPVGFRIAHVRIDGQFIPTYKIKILAGRNFREDISTDFGYIINEIAVKKIGWKSPEDAIGRVIEYSGRRGSVIGVVNDFHYESLHNPINPVLMSYDPASFNRVAIKVTPVETNKTIAFIEKTWQTYNISNELFSFEYLTDRYNKLYKSEDKIKMIFGYFMILAISIAVLGMAGLSLFIIERRTKEIGIRKINGATVPEIVILLNNDFVKWVVIAFIISAPIAYYSMHKWLESFAYKTELSLGIFVMSGLIASGIALLTVSWQSWRAATGNPVNALRNE
ncbi:MAG: FtsX-like permease family protein, partial [Bacteroidales bacterium]